MIIDSGIQVNIKFITATISEAAILLLLMGGGFVKYAF
jgi:hypothetical protein